MENNRKMHARMLALCALFAVCLALFLTVCFDGGGEMRFVVWMGLEEIKCFYMGEE